MKGRAIEKKRGTKLSDDQKSVLNYMNESESSVLKVEALAGTNAPAETRRQRGLGPEQNQFSHRRHRCFQVRALCTVVRMRPSAVPT